VRETVVPRLPRREESQPSHSILEAARQTLARKTSLETPKPLLQTPRFPETARNVLNRLGANAGVEALSPASPTSAVSPSAPGASGSADTSSGPVQRKAISTTPQLMPETLASAQPLPATRPLVSASLSLASRGKTLSERIYENAAQSETLLGTMRSL